MTFGAVLGLILALGLVLGLFGLAVGLARRFANVSGGRGDLRMVVIDRTQLGPRQGLAAVRIADRIVVVSVGDGGVHAVSELTAAETESLGLNDDGQQRPSRALPAGRATGRSKTDVARRGFDVIHAVARRGLRSIGARSAALAFAIAFAGLPARAGAQTAQAFGPNNTTAFAAIATATFAQGATTTPPQRQGSPPSVSLQLGNGGTDDFRVSGTVGTVLFMGVLATLPTLLLLMTSFTRVLVVLHFLRQALGTQGSPPAHLLAALSLLITGFIMAPTIADANTTAIQPWMRGEIDEVQMLKAGSEPFRTFMLNQTSDDELVRFVEMSGQPLPDTPEQVSLPVLMTAYATGELRAAFQMGFAIFLPFVVIDLVVSAVLTSMGMFMLPPTMIALPCKLLLFVLIDGWSLMVGSLIASFG